MNFKAATIAAIAGFSLALNPFSANAQDVTESHLDAARAAIASINATDLFDTILPEAAEALQASLLQNNPDLEAQISEIVTEQAIAIAARRADLETEVARIYARAIREEDLRAIAEFYNTDAGRALLENGPIATREASRAAVVWRAGIERDLRTAVSAQLAASNPRANVEAGEAATSN
ncbi:MAG: DUF2059 domain-containing protein [Pseudomonadota bacterium]